jgi:hypothetical protein
MQDFYENIALGRPKDVALQQAKIHYLETMDGQAAHPVYWSAFVQLGNSRPIHIQQKGKSKLWLWAVGGFCIFSLLGYRIKNKRA